MVAYRDGGTQILKASIQFNLLPFILIFRVLRGQILFVFLFVFFFGIFNFKIKKMILPFHHFMKITAIKNERRENNK